MGEPLRLMHFSSSFGSRMGHLSFLTLCSSFCVCSRRADSVPALLVSNSFLTVVGSAPRFLWRGRAFQDLRLTLGLIDTCAARNIIF